MKPRITELDMSPFDDQNVDLYTPIRGLLSVCTQKSELRKFILLEKK